LRVVAADIKAGTEDRFPAHVGEHDFHLQDRLPEILVAW